jgi:hypothetical protein
MEETPLVHSATYALLHVAAGVVAGTALTAVMPPRTETETLHETLAQVGVSAVLNGILVYGASRTIGQGDPTTGVVFLWALMASQPAFSARIVHLSSSCAAAVATHGATALASVRPQPQGSTPS